jgi:predicted dehydrogenase
MSRVKLALIGCGGMGQSHLRRFHVLKDRLHLVAAVDIDQAAAQRVATYCPQAKTAKDYGEVLDEVDAVLIALPHHLHHEVALACLRAGKHVLLEKPMANSERQCLDLIEESERSHTTLMVAYCMRYHPLVMGLKAALDQRVCGEIFQLSIWTEQLTQRPASSWVSRAATLGGGQLFSHGCHYIDLLLWFLGLPLSGTHMGTNRGTPWMEREGTSNVSLLFAEGRLGYHFGTWGARGSRLRYAIQAHCDEGMLEADITGKQLALYRGDQRQTLQQLADSGKHTENEMAHFLDCVETGNLPQTHARDALQSLRVIWRLYAAEERGELAHFANMNWSA